MKVSDIGEFGLIHRLQRQIDARGLPKPGADGLRFPLRVGIGDDAAAWETSAATELLTTDTMVEGVHFTRKPTRHGRPLATWREVGWKSMASNLSDIAAMGGVPQYALITLGLPQDEDPDNIDELYHGLLDACEAYGAAIIGGDIVGSPVFFITVALTGVTGSPLLLRTAARPGDQVAVTGTLGGAEGGLRMLLEGLAFDEATTAALLQAHLHRQPRVPEGQVLAANGVRCAMDVSDGLVDDLGKLCLASRVAARVFAHRLPLHPALRVAFPGQETALALRSGEEYELLFAAPPALMARVCPLLPAGATVIGEIVAGEPGSVSVEDERGRPVQVAKGGWDHFRP